MGLEVPCHVVNSSFKEFKGIFMNVKQFYRISRNLKEFKGLLRRFNEFKRIYKILEEFKGIYPPFPILDVCVFLEVPCHV